MIDLYNGETPNVLKVTTLLEETGLDYRNIPIDIGKGEQFDPAFLKISPNHRIPTIIDHDPPDGGDPLAVFESGAILVYLAEKTGQFLATEPRQRTQTLQWVFWQMAGLGPMSGQNAHFKIRAPEHIPYAHTRYLAETNRLYRVLDHQLEDRAFIADEYSIADMACYPWIIHHALLDQDLDDVPNVKRWFDTIAERPAVVRAYARNTEEVVPTAASQDEFWNNLFSPTAAEKLYR